MPGRLAILAVALLMVTPGSSAALAQRLAGTVSETSVLVDGALTVIRTYKGRALSDSPRLVVALHGDTAPWGVRGRNMLSPNASQPRMTT